MVIASNEWLNNYEDDQKSVPANTNSTTATTTLPTTTTPSTAATTTTATASTTTVARITTTTPSTDIQTVTILSATTDNANNDQQPEQEQEPMINSNSQTMDDTLKIEKEPSESENNNRASNTSINNSNSNSNSNTSLQSAISNSQISINTSNSNIHVNSVNSNSNVNSNLNSSTASPIFNPNPITPQALSNALQSALNATNTNSAAVVASGGNLQNSFLSSLAAVGGVSPNATLQHTANLAKQLSSSLCALESQTSLNNSSTLLDQNAMAECMLDNNGQAKIILICEPNSHPFQARSILLTPNIECKVGRLIAKSKASEANAIFDCKVLSRNHAVLWYSNDGKFWVKDTKSSNGTFVNEIKLGLEASELHFGDVVKFGVDVMENSRKEVHGCIIAGVKLYLPDGRETISIETSSTQLSQHSGEGRISFDELHRLNLYMQEAAQREKVLKSKLFNIQNILDATRKNLALCWQSMIAEDQLLHRIHWLEKKLQLMEKNVPENVLRSEVLKLLDDKNSYQHSAKEASRKVYQERCDAMQMLTKMESAFSTSDNECKILRDQIMNTKQSLNDVNTRLLCLETEYNDYKDETERQQQEAKEQSEQRTAELTEKLRQREFECEELRRQISELRQKRAELLDEEQLQKQAIEKLDAAIADMDLGDDEDDEDDDNDDGDEQDDCHKIEIIGEETKHGSGRKKNSLCTLDEINGVNAGDAGSDSSSEKEKTNRSQDEPLEETKPKVGKNSTILNWLKNSDLIKKEGSLDIFKAICNESDSSDEHESSPNSVTGAGTKRNFKQSIATYNISTTNNDNKADEEEFVTKCTKFNSKMRNVQKNLSRLEAEIANETNKTSNVIAALDDGSAVLGDEDSDEDDDNDDMDEENDVLTKRNGKQTSKECNPAIVPAVIAQDNKSYILLKKSVSMLREAYNEICDNMKPQKPHINQQTPPPANTVQTQFQKYVHHNPMNSAAKRLETQSTLKPNAEQKSDDDSEDNEDTGDDDASDATTRTSSTSLKTIQEAEERTGVDSSSSRKQQIDVELKEYQQKIGSLNEKLNQIENDSQNTLEIMQIECDAYKDKAGELSKLVATLRDEKLALEQVISENKSNAQKTAECSKHELVISEQLLPLKEKNEIKSRSTQQKDDDENSLGSAATGSTVTGGTVTDNSTAIVKDQYFEQQMREDLAAINNTGVQREEELIVYKERLDQAQNDNLQLRNEIADIRLKADAYYTQTLLKRMLPVGVIVVAILVYFIITYLYFK